MEENCITNEADVPAKSDDKQTKPKNKSCRCGRGQPAPDSNRHNCTKNNRYSSRCPCLKAMVLCTDNCQCLHCDNGNDDDVHNKCSGKEIKGRRDQDTLNKKKKEGWKFMKSHNEQTISGLWTEHEHYLFVAAFNALKQDSKDVNATNLLQLYNQVQQVIERDGIDIILANKTLPQVASKLSQQVKEIDIQAKCGKINYLP